MRARIAADGGLSSTTDARIEEFIERAAFLRRQYRVPTGAQTGAVLPGPDARRSRCWPWIPASCAASIAEQLIWLRAALEAARGKMVMAVLGHPFFAGGHDVSSGDEEFMALRELLRAHDVRIVMAGDTHDLEYYREAVAGDAGHVRDAPLGERRGRRLPELRYGAGVAGATGDGGLGVLPESAPEVVEKIDRVHAVVEMAGVGLDADGSARGPRQPEWLSAMFDYNVAPFFQSFVVVTVDPAARRSSSGRGASTARSPGAISTARTTLMPLGVTPDRGSSGS